MSKKQAMQFTNQVVAFDNYFTITRKLMEDGFRPYPGFRVKLDKTKKTILAIRVGGYIGNSRNIELIFSEIKESIEKAADAIGGCEIKEYRDIYYILQYLD